MDPRTKAERLILRGYGPLAGLVVVLLFLTLLVPSRPLTTITASGAADVPAAPVPVPTEDAIDEASALPVGEEAVTGTTIAGTATSGPAAARRPGRTAASGPGTSRPGAGATGGTVASATKGAVAGPGTVTIGRDCSGGALQDSNTPYSPPCLKWTGTDHSRA